MVYKPLILTNIQNFNEESLHYIMGKRALANKTQPVLS